MPARPEGAFQYAVLRVVPDVDRGERLNAGVVLFARTLDFLGARVGLDERRLLALWPDADAAAGRGRRPGRRADRRAAAVAALPLAGFAVEHRRAAVRGPHRPLRRSGRRARASLRAARRLGSAACPR